MSNDAVQPSDPDPREEKFVVDTGSSSQDEMLVKN